ncbi:hypothetical protein BT96DRAFT_1005579 [Gymnopus androsaceus JB14]|uniref:Uncharacterized protein n=1 Tax=Gymnopus androsaceus JB14 TaxID=1447944 RepID=A0A6A4GNC9_9AGAR|nr:hypothetical protein BT96DRAFT_1005579 [Gymnopus androsaceus JB14]
MPEKDLQMPERHPRMPEKDLQMPERHPRMPEKDLQMPERHPRMPVRDRCRIARRATPPACLARRPAPPRLARTTPDDDHPPALPATTHRGRSPPERPPAPDCLSREPTTQYSHLPPCQSEDLPPRPDSLDTTDDNRPRP